MPHSTNKELVLGIMVGTTGISLLLLWYHKICKPKTAMHLPKFLTLGNAFDSVPLQDEMQKDQGTAVIFQGRQLQILEKLNELLTSMEELREEIRILKETIPKLEECVRGELGGKATAHRISPQHRARKRRLTTVQSSGTSNSSEEAESEGGCFKKEQNFQQNCPAIQVTEDPLHHGISPVSHQPNFLPAPSSHFKIRKVSISRGSNFTTSTISLSSSSDRRLSLFGKFPKSIGSLQRQQSRANFESEDKSSIIELKPCSEHFAFKSRRHFSTPKLSIISCYESAMFIDLQSSGENIVDPNEIETASKISSSVDVGKYLSSCPLDYNTRHFLNFDTKSHSLAFRDSNGHATFLSLPPLLSHYLISDNDSDTQERRSQPKEELLPADLQSHSASQHPAVTSGNTTSDPHKVAWSYKHPKKFTPVLQEVTDSFDDGNNAKSSEDEDKSSPSETPNLRSPQILTSLRRAAQIRSFSIRHTLSSVEITSVFTEASSLTKLHYIF